TDVNSLAGAVRAHAAAKATGLKLIVGAEITPGDALPILLYTANAAAYRNLSRLISRGRRAAPKGECCLSFQDVADYAGELLAAVIAPPATDDAGLECSSLVRYRELFAGRCYLATSIHHGPDDEAKLERHAQLARQASLPLMATNAVYYHDPGR